MIEKFYDSYAEKWSVKVLTKYYSIFTSHYQTQEPVIVFQFNSEDAADKFFKDKFDEIKKIGNNLNEA